MQKNSELYDELAAFRETLTTGLARINHRIDHIAGQHVAEACDGCPSCLERGEGEEQ